jgi:hypothetical protein
MNPVVPEFCRRVALGLKATKCLQSVYSETVCVLLFILCPIALTPECKENNENENKQAKTEPPSYNMDQCPSA